jgi:thioredoxin reductase
LSTHLAKRGISRKRYIERGGFVLKPGLLIPFEAGKKINTMKDDNNYDVIIIGGSYAGLSAAMALGRSLRRVLIIDSGKPCNRQAPQAHNFITQDGQTPKQITDKAKEQVLAYKTVHFYPGIAVSGKQINNGFEVETDKGESFGGRKLLFATGIVDEMPAIPGFAECWGISALHCPYCHGYEVSGTTIGLLVNGDIGYDFCKLISNWSKNLIVFTNGKSSFTDEQASKLHSKGFQIVEKIISAFEHKNGYIQQVLFQDGSKQAITAMFARLGFSQHSEIPVQLGCLVTDQGLIQVDDFQKTTVSGVFAAGDNTMLFRAVALAAAAGSKAGAFLNKELIEEDFI